MLIEFSIKSMKGTLVFGDKVIIDTSEFISDPMEYTSVVFSDNYQTEEGLLKAHAALQEEDFYKALQVDKKTVYALEDPYDEERGYHGRE